MTTTLQNFVAGSWVNIEGADAVPVLNPATAKIIAVHPCSTDADVDMAVAAAKDAFWKWRMTPVPTRSAIMFRYRQLVWEARAEIARIIVEENGKNLEEADGEILRAIQYIEHACAVTETMKGSVSENIGTGVDIEYIREPLGPFAIIAPFNFPAMIPLYFTWAVATGNTVILKPSELCPLTTVRLVELAAEAGMPPGVVNMVLGDRRVVERLAQHPDVVGASFVGSSEIAEHVYKLFTSNGKRCQAQGGSKNHLVVTDTAIIERSLPNIVSSMLGSTSQRCFAGSNLLVYRSIYDAFLERFLDGVKALRLGYGMDEGVDLGPVISRESRERLVTAVDRAATHGSKVLLDGRDATVPDYPNGYWLGPIILTADPGMEVFDRELFGPVRCIREVSGLDEALEIVNASTYGHTAAIYTEQGGVAREFRQRAEVGQIGVNVGTPAPIGFYAVGGRKSSFYGSLRGRANDAVDFYTDKKTVVSTWHVDTTQRSGVDPAFEGAT
ncbi:MAG TPA: CoA-acylating methylmalonate-semialdehyde dehydrogenase [Actinomycetota bacterium]|nr:CoA-acylating methylmalonate-semialdehyde dehydrogenase [Actinomycetota bacterium]